jgi:uncharacterized protein with HEPN domain
MLRDDAAFLDVVNFARRIVELTSMWTYESFESDELKQLSVLHLFTLLGESVRRLPDDFQLAHPGIPWARIVGMRNKLIHDYDDVDLELVWTTAMDVVPGFLATMEAIGRQQNSSDALGE